ncbi:PREDICTED: F-box only protein 8-like isoform X2 [Priapulus caudatus]|uniref:F-box only protein 8-like isoform X2 n=1 Tax=Priapulus caudatus TaxID=37621 RepID=A0ABM1F1Z6_PRICU|nr:PREDICTED: F-box only protein 8-like isoform X2 [Priapulus caudatus]
MGQALFTRILERGYMTQDDFPRNRSDRVTEQDDNTVAPTFPDLKELPPELALGILSHLGATDLCLASCVWNELADDEVLWESMCRNTWQYVSIYWDKTTMLTWKQIYLLLDEGSLTFNADASMGMAYFFKNGLLKDSPVDIAKFFHSTRQLSNKQVRIYLEERPYVLDYLLNMQSYEREFLPNALRKLFARIEAPSDRGSYLATLLQKFSKRFCQCNPQTGLQTDDVFVLCYSLILLSVDLFCPHVKNKMSKREFIRNVRGAIPNSNDDLAGHLYDNIYLVGHIAPGDRL